MVQIYEKGENREMQPSNSVCLEHEHEYQRTVVGVIKVFFVSVDDVCFIEIQRKHIDIIISRIKNGLFGPLDDRGRKHRMRPNSGLQYCWPPQNLFFICFTVQGLLFPHLASPRWRIGKRYLDIGDTGEMQDPGWTKISILQGLARNRRLHQ